MLTAKNFLDYRTKNITFQPNIVLNQKNIQFTPNNKKKDKEA